MLYLAALLSSFNSSHATEIGRFTVPSLDGYVLERSHTLDKDATPDGNKETLVEVYAKDGQYLLRYSTQGQVWAWGVIGNPAGGPEDSEANYALRDSDGDRIYDERYVRDEEYFLPAWIGELKPA